MNYYDFYSKMKTKYKNTATFIDHRNTLAEKCANRFIWSGYEDLLPPVAPSTWLEYKLMRYGAVCVAEIDGQLTLAPCTMSGGLSKRFGTPEKVIYYTNGGKAGELNIDDTVVCLNNSKFYPTYLTIDRYAEMLTETDKSISCLTKFSRLIPIPVAETDSQKQELEKAIDDIIEGKPKIIKSAHLKGVEKVDLLDPDQIKNMECLSRLHDELIKRVCSELGISINTKDKGAQLSIEELDSFGQYDALSLYIPFALRKMFVEQVNEKYGLNGSVVLNPIFDNLENGVNKSKEEMLESDDPADPEQPETEKQPEDNPTETEENTDGTEMEKDN